MFSLLKKRDARVERLTKRLKDNADIYKIDPRYGTVRVDTSNPRAAKEITDAATRFFNEADAP